MPDVTEAQKNLEAAQVALDKAKADKEAEDAALAAPRPVGSITLDLLRWLVSRAGNHPTGEKLLKELELTTGVTYDPETNTTKPIAPASKE